VLLRVLGKFGHFEVELGVFRECGGHGIEGFLGISPVEQVNDEEIIVVNVIVWQFPELFKESHEHTKAQIEDFRPKQFNLPRL